VSQQGYIRTIVESPAGFESPRKSQLLEVLVFLFLIVPSMVLSFFALRQGSVSFELTAAATMLRDLALVSLIAFFLWRNGELVGMVGWKASGAGREIVLGLTLFLPFLAVTSVIERVFQAAGLSTPSMPLPRFLTAAGLGEYALASLLVVVVAIAEETIFRGYLLLRLRAVTQSTAAAALLSAFVFSLGHGYEGAAGVATVGVMGLIFAVIYLWRRSLVAPVVMHFLQDFLGIVVLPLLSHKR
jgi:membrane protease YdiL (CAAX protease family)